MEFLQTHWHCVLPLAAIVLGMVLLKKKDDTEEKDE
jgi:hypothetical protein